MTYKKFTKELRDVASSLYCHKGKNKGTAAELFLKAVIDAMNSENQMKGMTDARRRNLPDDTLLDPSSEAIWKSACDEINALVNE
jgi:hypothetical protein